MDQLPISNAKTLLFVLFIGVVALFCGNELLILSLGKCTVCSFNVTYVTKVLPSAFDLSGDLLSYDKKRIRNFSKLIFLNGPFAPLYFVIFSLVNTVNVPNENKIQLRIKEL